MDFLVKQFFDLSTDMLCIADTHGYYIKLNPKWSETLGYSTEELLAKPYIEFIHPEDRENTQRGIAQLFKGKANTKPHNRHLKKDGTYVWLSWRANAHHGFIYGVAREINEFKENEQYLEEIQKSSKIGAWRLPVNDDVISATSQVHELLGIPCGKEIRVKEALRPYPPQFRKQLIEAFRDAIYHGISWEFTLPFKNSKGKSLWIKNVGIPLFENEKITEIYGSIQDITQQKLLELESKSTGDKLHDILVKVPGLIYQFKLNPDNSLTIPYASQQVYSIYEITQKDFEDSPEILFKMLHPEEIKTLISAVKTSAKELSEFEWTGRIISKSGLIKWIRAKSLPQKHPNDGSILWTGMFLDITQERKLQEYVQEQQNFVSHRERLAQIGELAAGVGHEINNPLAIANATIELIKKKTLQSPSPDPVTLSAISKYELATQRISNIVDGLKMLAHADSDEMSLLDLNNIVKQSTQLICEIYAKNEITLKVHLYDEPAIVTGNLGRIQQSLMNLLSNAKQAIERSDLKRITVQVFKINHEYHLSVGDTGSGIEKSIQHKILDPFFTTKRIGEGTGIGLSISATIMKDHGGRLDFTSDSDGSDFRLVFPAVQNMTTLNNTPELKDEKSEANLNLKVLVVDDEPDLREILSEIIISLGCKVTTATNGRDALALAQTHSYDAILTDIQMPVMSGEAFIQEAQKDKNHISSEIFVLTGRVGAKDPYSMLASEIRGRVNGVIAKPFRFEQIEKALKGVSQNLGRCPPPT